MESNEEKRAAGNGWVPGIKMRLPESAGPGCDLSPSDPKGNSAAQEGPAGGRGGRS